MTPSRLAIFILTFSCWATACSGDDLCPIGWYEADASGQCVATTSRMVELVDGLGTSGVYGYSGSVSTGLPPCGGATFEPITGPVTIALASSGSCTEDEVVVLTPNAEGEWAAELTAGEYCAGSQQFTVDEGLFTEVVIGR